MPSTKRVSVSLVVPVKNEEDSIEALIDSVLGQTSSPAETIIVDGGSIDGTIELIKTYVEPDTGIRIIEAGVATPGRGRNIGVAAASHDWVAFADAGMILAPDWLEKLLAAAESNPNADIVYGSFEPVAKSLFARCVALCTIAPRTATSEGLVSQRIVASSMMKKTVWETIGGFPDQRAAEDLIFMEMAEKLGFQSVRAPKAMVRWQMQSSVTSTFQRFRIYSFHNVLIDRQRDWHYGIARKYLAAIPFLMLALVHRPYWLFAPFAGWFARAQKSIWVRREERGIGWVANPIQIAGVMLALLVIDSATFAGWIAATLQRKRKPVKAPGLEH